MIQTTDVLACLAAIFVVSSVGAQSTGTRAEWREECRDIEIPMRDGKKLLADRFLPKAAGRYPTVLIQTPYGKGHLGAPIARGADLKKIADVGRGAISDTLGLLDREHYAYVVVDWRGFHANKAAMRGVNRRKWRRGHDGFDCVEWIAKRPWSNGKVGTWGGSALGKQQFDTAVEHPPHLVCCVPLIAAMGVTYDQYFKGGVPLDAHLRILDRLGYDVRAKVRNNPLPDTWLWRIAKRRSYRPSAVEVPCLMITGWWDHHPDAIIRTFEDMVAGGGAAAKEHDKLLIGPWDHVGVGLAKQGDLRFPEAERASAKAAKAFFDFHLRGEKNGWSETPRVQFFDSGNRKWASAATWTKLDRVTTRWFARADGSIQDTAGDGSGSRKYRFDPKHPSPTLGGANLPPLPHGPRVQNALLDRDDVLVYRTGKLVQGVFLNGKLEVDFTFVADRVDCDFCLRLCDVDEQGLALLISDTAVRAKLRHGEVEPLTPGEPCRIAVRFPHHCHTFVPGHELLLIVTSGNSPRFERNPHTGANLWDRKTAKDLHVEIRHAPAAPFELKIPRRKAP